MKRFLSSVVLALLCSAVRALAQVANGDTLAIPGPSSYAPSMFGIVVKLIISMVIIIGLIYFSTYFLKKLNSRGSGGSVGDAIKVLGRTFISPKQCLYLVKIGEKYAILGATDSNISMITEMSKDDAEKFDKQGTKGKDANQPARFSDFLKGMMRP
jgi:flagellar biosynthetic protein FliO